MSLIWFSEMINVGDRFSTVKMMFDSTTYILGYSLILTIYPSP